MPSKSTPCFVFAALCQLAACADPSPPGAAGSSSDPGTTTQAAPEPTTTTLSTTTPDPPETTTTSSGTGTGTATGTSAPTSTSSTTGAPDLCSVTSHDPLSAPLDIFVMLDRSSSMATDTGDGVTKWEAVTGALTSFALADEADTRIGLQLFPRLVDGTDSCSVADYTKPLVPIYATPEVAPSLTDAVDAFPPFGNTTTGPALQGAIDYTHTWALADPTRPVVVVLATDGVASLCTPTDSAGLAAIAAAGLAGSPSITTFVIGVLNADDIGGQQTIDAIASAGGTGTAFLLDGEHLSESFLEALATIRGTKLPCVYAIPPIDASLGYDDVDLQHTPDGQQDAQEIPHVADSAACDPVTGGWHYDVDPAQGPAPTQILLCSQTCSALASGGTLEILVGCEARDAA